MSNWPTEWDYHHLHACAASRLTEEGCIASDRAVLHRNRVGLRSSPPARPPRCHSHTEPRNGQALVRRKAGFPCHRQWHYADEQLAYVAPATDHHFHVEIQGGGDPTPVDVRPYTEPLSLLCR